MLIDNMKNISYSIGILPTGLIYRSKYLDWVFDLSKIIGQKICKFQVRNTVVPSNSQAPWFANLLIRETFQLESIRRDNCTFHNNFK